MFKQPVGEKRFCAPWFGPGIVAIAFVVAAFLTWRKWPDPLVDFGMQLYLPWKISHGLVLYRDAEYLTGGPLSQYYHALLFKIFGASLLTVVVSNLLIAAALIALIYRRFLAAADAWTATTISLGIVLVFAFAQYSNIGNYNYITPYSHEVWHGLALSIAAMALLATWISKEQIAYALGAGFCAGLVFMTKPDVFAALSAGAITALVLAIASKKRSDLIWKSVAAFVIAALIPLLAFLLLFHRAESWRGSLRSVCFAWVPLLGSAVSKTPFYKWCLGLDAPWLNFRLMCLHFMAVCAVVVVSAAIFRRKLTQPANRLLAAGWVALLLALASGFDWVECGRSLPLLDVSLCVALCISYRKLPEAPVFPLLWSVFGLVLLAKLGLYSRVWHYGFALAMPAFAGAIYLLLWLLPRLLEKWGVPGSVFRGAIWLVLMVGFARLFVQSQFVFADKTVVVGNGSDTFFASAEKTDPTGAAMQSALVWMEKNAPPDTTLAVLPEGIMVNYLSRRTNPTHYLLWNPNDMAAFGQAKMTADFENHPPDYVMLIHRDASEYGVKYFGQEERFGRELMQWIQKNYEPVDLIGSEPLVNSHFGIKILKRLPQAK